MNDGFQTLSALWSVRDDRALSGAEQRVLLMLIAHADENGAARPSVRTLAKESRLRVTSVRAALRALEGRRGPVLVKVTRGRRSDAGDHDRHEYLLSPGEGWVKREPTWVNPEPTVDQSGTHGVGSQTVGGGSNGNPEEDKKRKEEEDTEENSLALGVFGDWSSILWPIVHKQGKPRATEARLKPIRGRLRDGITRDQFKVIFAKVAASKFHVDGGYIEPKTIVPNLEKAEWWLARKPAGNVVPLQTGVVDGVDPNQWGKEAGEALAGGAE